MVTTTLQTGEREALMAAEIARQQSLPPTDRDFEVYEWLAGRGDSTRGAARQFGISQTRMMQIRQRVVEWIDRCAPPSIPLSPERRVQLAAAMAFDRPIFSMPGPWSAFVCRKVHDERPGRRPAATRS